jgi:hypothetical protein
MQPEHKKRKFNIMALVLCAGLIIGMYGFYSVYMGYKSQQWPAVDGQIVYSQVIGSTRIIGRKASIKYEYYIAEQRYIGTLVSYTWKCVDYQGFISVLRNFSEGAEVPVYYDPQNPKKAVLKTDISRSILWMFLFSALTIMIGMIGLVRQPRNADSADNDIIE